MSLQLAALIGSGGLAICGGIGLAAALAWLPQRQPLHSWLAASALAVAIWAYAALARHIPALSPTTPAYTAYLMLSAQVLAPIAFYAFVRRLQPPADVYARGLLVWTPVYATVFLLLIWTGQAARIPSGWDDHSFDLTRLGALGLIHAAVYGLIPFFLLRLKTGVDGGHFGPAGLALALAVSASLWPLLRGAPVDLALVALAVGLMAATALRQQFYSPLLATSRQLQSSLNEMRATITDLAAEKAEAERVADELREANRANVDFLTQMSHALRTPLNSIVGYSELLLNGIYGDLDERQIDRIDKIHRNGQQLLGLLNDSLDLTRLEAGRLTLDVRTLRLTAIIDAAQAALVLPESGAVIVERDLHLPLRLVRGDEMRIRQVIHTLLARAVRETPRGTVRLRARSVTVRDGRAVHEDRADDVALPARGWLEDRHWVLISVEDQGPGIPPAEQALIFEAFRQAGDPARQEDGTGVGLELVVAKRLVELHAGRIWVRSAPGAGSEFLVALPAQETFDAAE